MKEFIICFTENRWYSLDISNDQFIEDHEISFRNKYYTFQVSDFIRELKSKKFRINPDIINLESFDKQFSQRGKDLYDFKKWHILKALRREEIIDSTYKITDLKDFLLDVKDLLHKLIENSDVEIDRFNTIELKINEIIHKTSFEGIKIDRNILDNKCFNIHKAIYDLKNEFQFLHNIFQPDYLEAQSHYLKNKNYKILSSVENTIRLLRKSDVICGKFHKLNRLIKDLNTLMILKSRLGGIDFVNPYFVGFGSITSRIIIKEPSLQNLRKENRDIIIPNEGKELFYIDYNQFEASILAHCSTDTKLLNLINAHDVYADIVEKIYDKKVDDDSRKEAKILFYRYLYGDTFENNLKLKKKVETYFSKFTQLSKFKGDLIKASTENGYVETKFGNYRKLDLNNENIWILSHFIQSKASYIFKKAIIETYQKVKNARLILPLHDGALYEIDEKETENIRFQITKIFKEAFQKECSLLANPQAIEQDFYYKQKN